MYLIMLIVGFSLGHYLRKKVKRKIPYSNIIQLVLIYANVVFMGIRIGIREEIINNIFTIGISSLVFTVFILIFATWATSIGRKVLGFDKYGERYKGKNFLIQKENSVREIVKDYKESKKKNDYTMTIVILICAIVGIAVGYLFVYRGLQNKTICGGDINVFEKNIAKIIDVLIGTLILLIGVELGYDEKTVGNVKKAGFLIFLFPIFNIIGTTLGAIIASIFCRMDMWDAMALGEGYAWFSIAPSILLKYGLVEPAAISFLHNVLREIISIIFIPIVAKRVGYIECICLSGAAAMDDCLPIIEKSTTPTVAIYGFVSGVFLTALVPVFTPFFASMAVR